MRIHSRFHFTLIFIAIIASLALIFSLSGNLEENTPSENVQENSLEIRSTEYQPIDIETLEEPTPELVHQKFLNERDSATWIENHVIGGVYIFPDDTLPRTINIDNESLTITDVAFTRNLAYNSNFHLDLTTEEFEEVLYFHLFTKHRDSSISKDTPNPCVVAICSSYPRIIDEWIIADDPTTVNPDDHHRGRIQWFVEEVDHDLESGEWNYAKIAIRYITYRYQTPEIDV